MDNLKTNMETNSQYGGEKPAKIRLAIARIASQDGENLSDENRIDSQEKNANEISEMLLKLKNEGYGTISHGDGPWITKGSERIKVSDEWCVRHPEGKVAAITIYKTEHMDYSAEPHDDTVRSDYETDGEYLGHLDEWQIQIGPDYPISILDQPESQEKH